MATKLKNLKITKVDFVDEGANPDADIMLFKRKDGAPEAAADAADLERDDRSLMKRLLDAFRSTFASMEPEGEGQIGKSATSFDEEYRRQNLNKIVDDMWNLTYALYSSLCSILYDEELDAAQKQSAMTDSVGDFNTAVKQAIEVWTTGEPYGIILKSDDEPVSDNMISAMKSARDRLSASIEKAAQQSKGTPTTNNTTPKGEESDMKFDKSKMTPAERAMLEQFEKNYGMDDAAPAADVTAAAPAVDPAVNKSATPAAPAAQTTPAETPAADDLFKGLSPEMKAEFEALRKFREDTEDSQLHAVAKSYEIIGKKDEELFPILKSMKKTDQAAYDQMIAALDSAKAAVEKSGVFSEIGKSGTGAPAQGGAVKEAETKAAELMKSKSGLTWAQALDEVLQGDPELAKRYEKEE